MVISHFTLIKSLAKELVQLCIQVNYSKFCHILAKVYSLIIIRISGKTKAGIKVAVKLTNYDLEALQLYDAEIAIYILMNATTDKNCERYGIPYIYFYGDALGTKVIVMPEFEHSLDSLKAKEIKFTVIDLFKVTQDLVDKINFDTLKHNLLSVIDLLLGYHV